MAELKCYRCGATLTRQDVCLQCGEDMRLYKRINYSADHLYNLGLERAKARDLSCARNYLRECLQLNKEHIQARNLLGLIYYEIGEPAKALREWVLSSSFQVEDNPAFKYLRSMERNISSVNGSVSRYNMAVTYLQNNSIDLAAIQLKQLMGRPYQLLLAKQLMALIYMREEHYGKAQKLLKECLKIDRGNPLTLKYLRGLDEHKKASQSSSYRRAMSEAVNERSNADVIIPHNTREYGSYFMYVLYILIGIILGAGLVYFIVVPTVRSKEQTKTQTALLEYEQSIGDWQVEVVKEQAEKKELEKSVSKLKETIAAYEGEEGGLTYDVFLPVLAAYADNDPKAIETEFYKLDSENKNDDYQKIYKSLKADILVNLGQRAYYRAAQYLDATDYASALDMYKYSVEKMGYNCKLIYYIALCYQMLDQDGWAVYFYQYDIVTYPDDPFVANAKARLDSLLEKNPELEVPDLKPGEMGDGKAEAPNIIDADEVNEKPSDEESTEETTEEASEESTTEEASEEETIEVITEEEKPDEMGQQDNAEKQDVIPIQIGDQDN